MDSRGGAESEFSRNVFGIIRDQRFREVVGLSERLASGVVENKALYRSNMKARVAASSVKGNVKQLDIQVASQGCQHFVSPYRCF